MRREEGWVTVGALVPDEGRGGDTVILCACQHLHGTNLMYLRQLMRDGRLILGHGYCG